ncbi:hypothetical protein GCM10022245_40820 [Streptomyces mayteni]
MRGGQAMEPMEAVSLSLGGVMTPPSTPRVPAAFRAAFPAPKALAGETAGALRWCA